MSTISIDYANYEISAILKLDQTLPSGIDISLDNCSEFKLNRILSFQTVKNIYDYNCVPLSSIVLDSLTMEEYHVVNKSLVLVEITISFKGNAIYKNIYKIITATELENNTSKINITFKKMELILKSNFVYNFLQDNTFHNLNKVNLPAFNNLKVFEDTISYIKSSYGNSISGNTTISDYSLSVFNNYFFNIELTNFRQMIKLIHINRISNSPTLFGIDECFVALPENGKPASVANGTSSEIITHDLSQHHSFGHMDAKIIKVIRNMPFEMSNAIFVEPYFSNNYLKNILQSQINYKNTVDNKINKLKVLEKTFLKLTNDGKILPIMEYTNSGYANIYEAKGNLSINDVAAYRDNILKFTKAKPKIMKISFSKAPLDIFKLGKKTNLGGLSGVSVTVAAEIHFDFVATPNPQSGYVKEEHCHQCSGNLYLLNWSSD